MQINGRVAGLISRGALFVAALSTVSIVSGCDKIKGLGKLNSLAFPSAEGSYDPPKVEPGRIVPMQETLDRLKSIKLHEQEAALEVIHDWMNDGLLNDKDVKAGEALLEYIWSYAPARLRGKAVGILIGSADDKTAGGRLQQALESQLADDSKGLRTAEAMVEFASDAKAAKAHRNKAYDSCAQSDKADAFIANKLFGSDKESSQSIKQFMQAKKDLLSQTMQGALEKRFSEVVIDLNWGPNIDHLKSIVLLLKDRMDTAAYIRLLLAFAWSPKTAIRDLLAEDTFRDGLALHQHQQIVIDALNKTPVDSLAAKATVEWIRATDDFVLMGAVLLDSGARERIDKTGVPIAAALVAHVNGLIDALEASVLLERTTLAGTVPIGWDTNVDANRRNQAKATLARHVLHLHLPELKDAVADKLRELTAFANVENIQYRYQAGLGGGAPAGQFNIALNPAVAVDLNDALIPLHQMKFQIVTVVLTELNNATLNQHLRDQAAYIRRGRAPLEAPLGWGLP